MEDPARDVTVSGRQVLGPVGVHGLLLHLLQDVGLLGRLLLLDARAVANVGQAALDVVLVLLAILVERDALEINTSTKLNNAKYV